MHKSVHNLIQIEKEIQSNIINLNTATKSPKIIAVSKTHPMASILPLINHGHLDFGENKVQEAIDKWSDIKNKKNNIKLHLIGRLQTNKVKFALKIFDYIHSLDSEKLANKISDEQIKQEDDKIVFDYKQKFRRSQIENEGNDPAKTGESQGTPSDMAMGRTGHE